MDNVLKLKRPMDPVLLHNGKKERLSKIVFARIEKSTYDKLKKAKIDVTETIRKYLRDLVG